MKIMDTLIDVINKDRPDEEKVERLHSQQKVEYGNGKWRNTDGTYTK